MILLGPLASGCSAVGPDYVRPEAEIQGQWLASQDPHIKSEPAELRAWWKVLKDPVLDALIQKAVTQNLDVHRAAVRILESRAVRAIAAGNRYPQVQKLNAGYSRVTTSENTANRLGADDHFGLYNAGFDVGWELDVWGKFGRAVEATTAELQASIATYDDLVVSLAAEVAAAYVQMRTFEVRLEIARENVQIQEHSLAIAEARSEAGAVTELDVDQARSLLENTRALVPTLQLGVRQMRNGLSVLLGEPPNTLQDDLGRTQAIPAVPSEVTVGLPAELLRRRPDIRAAERLAVAQCAKIGIAEAELYPSFTMLGSLGLETSDNGPTLRTAGKDAGDLFSGDSIFFSFGGSIVWPFLNYGRLKNNVRVQDARFQQLILNYKNSVLLAAREVEDAMAGYLRSQEQAGFLAKSASAAESAVVIAQTQYRDGAVDYQRVLDTQRFLTAERDLHAQVQGEVVLHLIALYKALGGGWEIGRKSDFIPSSIQAEMRARTDWDGWLPADVPGKAESESGTPKPSG